MLVTPTHPGLGPRFGRCFSINSQPLRSNVSENTGFADHGIETDIVRLGAH